MSDYLAALDGVTVTRSLLRLAPRSGAAAAGTLLRGRRAPGDFAVARRHHARRRVLRSVEPARARRGAGAHAVAQSRTTGTGWPDRIRDAGITALAIDLRGHGALVRARAGRSRRWSQDVRAAAQWLADAPERAARMPSASSARRSAPTWRCWPRSDLPQVRAIGLLSPSLDYRGLRIDTALIKQLGARSIWLAASSEDPLALRTLRDIAAETVRAARAARVERRSAHGTVLLDARPRRWPARWWTGCAAR